MLTPKYLLIQPTQEAQCQNTRATDFGVELITITTMPSPVFAIAWLIIHGSATARSFVVSGELVMMMRGGCFIITTGLSYMLILFLQIIYQEIKTTRPLQGLITV